MKKNIDDQIYISIPITGRKIDEVKEEVEIIKFKYKHIYGYKFVFTPFDIVCDINIPYNTAMGMDIKVLLDSDIVVFCNDWENSKGCQLEHSAAKIYNKKIIYEHKNKRYCRSGK